MRIQHRGDDLYEGFNGTSYQRDIRVALRDHAKYPRMGVEITHHVVVYFLGFSGEKSLLRLVYFLGFYYRSVDIVEGPVITSTCVRARFYDL